jgi:hypothetical protein
MSQHSEASFEAIGKSACLFLPVAFQGRRDAKPAMAPFTLSSSTSIVFLNFGCSTTARYLKSSDRSFALSQSTFWPSFHLREAQHSTSSLRTQGPIPRCPIDKSEMADVFQNNWCRGVWVPAFAGTTSSFSAASPAMTGSPYCTLSATKRNSPSPFETRSSTDFLPSFLS